MAKAAFVWENFGPMHDDRCEAVARRLGGADEVLGIELAAVSGVYQWTSQAPTSFRKQTLTQPGHPRGVLSLARGIVSACRRARTRHVFVCHYERPEIFLASLMLRSLGARVYVMNDSKYDDYPRHLRREFLKSLLHSPYRGGLAGSERSKDYMRFLGLREERIRTGYDSVAMRRVRDLAGQSDLPFEARDFIIVARLVPKKNISTALDALARFSAKDTRGRKLHICGAGPLEADLKAKAQALGIQDRTVFHGFEPFEAIAPRMASALALLLPSIEEQFGFVIAEAQALGLPVIVSTNCGARDHLVRTGVNGFVVEPDNPDGMAYFMSALSEDEPLWRRMSGASFAEAADVDHFADAVVDLMQS